MNFAARFTGVPRYKVFFCLILLLPAIFYWTPWSIRLCSKDTLNRLNLSTKVDKEEQIQTVKVQFVHRSFKPEYCSMKVGKPHCFGPDSIYRHGVNQTKNISTACFPTEVTLHDIPWVDRDFPPTSKVLPIEMETMNDVEFVDMATTVNLQDTKIYIDNPEKIRNVGEVLKMRIDLFDKAGRPRKFGGDDVRVLIESHNSTDYRACGEVVDLKNGSYQATFIMLWEGYSVISITLPYTREIKATMLKWRRQYKTVFYYFGIFKKGKKQEYTVCSAYSPIPGYKLLCDLTATNDGPQFFCGQPLNRALNCNNLVSVRDLDFSEIPVNYAVYAALARSNLMHKMRFKVKLRAIKAKTPMNRKNCNQMQVRETWNTTMPSGFVFKKQYIYFKCNNHIINYNTARLCLRNTTLFIYGDSTTRQWYAYVMSMTTCKQITKKWSSSKWYDYSECFNKALNFTLIWAPHTLPFPVGSIRPGGKLNLRSVGTYLDEIPSTGRIMFVFHLYAHFTRQHYSLYWDYIKSLKSAIRKALKRNKNLTIAIKSPHVFYHSNCMSTLNDLHGPIYIDILQNEFEEFKDSVLFLNYWEMTQAVENFNIHPPGNTVWENIRHLLGFVCN